jgi:hypothetical protein
MFRGILESVLSEEVVNGVFESHAQRQYCRELMFSKCADLMLEVVARIHPSMNAAYKARSSEISVSVASVYNKLNGIEPAVCEALVQTSARQMARVIDDLKGAICGPVPGYDTRILDGNHLAGTDHRIKELRNHGAAALPGHSLAILDPQRRLIEDVVVCHDAHANQRILFSSVLKKVLEGQCWIGDSHFCTLGFLFGVQERKATFVVRQHEQLQGVLIGKRKPVGRGETGPLFEQTMRIQLEGKVLEIRRITIVRDKPTNSGDTEIHLLTNLPAKIRAKRVAQSYRDRWQIETAFQDVTTNLRCEINTLGYPGAAAFGFCIALIIYNTLAVAKAAILTTTPKAEQITGNLSTYALADEIGGMWRGMMIAVPETVWSETFGSLTIRQLAQKLRQLAKQVDLQKFTTYPWTPKQPQKQKISGNRGNHRATYRVIQQRKSKTSSP